MIANIRIVILLLAVVAGAAVVASRSKIPAAILLVLIGLALSLAGRRRNSRAHGLGLAIGFLLGAIISPPKKWHPTRFVLRRRYARSPPRPAASPP